MGRGRSLLYAACRQHPATMTGPLRMSFEVACSAEQAFTTWTSRMSSWWPEDHTVTGEAGLEVVLEPGVGGRIYERTRAGAEHDWGRVTAWEPPARLARPQPQCLADPPPHYTTATQGAATMSLGTKDDAWPLAGQSSRRLARPAPGLPRPFRYVPTAAARTPRLGRPHPRKAQQPYAGPLSAATREAVSSGQRGGGGQHQRVAERVFHGRRDQLPTAPVHLHS